MLFASNDRDALISGFDKIENEPDSHLCLDLNDSCIYEFLHTETIQPFDRYKHLCKECASGLDAFGSALLVRESSRRILNYRNIAANVLNAIRGKEVNPYMIGIDVGVKDLPVAQVFRKDGDQWVVTNTIVGDAVGHLITYMEGTTDA
jgi:hypothetical protein